MASEDTGWIVLRKLNLLLGRNSSGKTVLIRALRLMKQSLLAENSQQPLTFEIPGGVDVGSFGTLLHKVPVPPSTEDDSEGQSNEESRYWPEKVTFSFRISLNNREFYKDIDSSPFEVNLSYGWDSQDKCVVMSELEVYKTTSDDPVKVLSLNLFRNSISIPRLPEITLPPQDPGYSDL